MNAILLLVPIAFLVGLVLHLRTQVNRPPAILFLLRCSLALGVLYGVTGFSAQAIVCSGGLQIPASIEWPVWPHDPAATSESGRTRVVSLLGPGRVQVYDHRGAFLTGWQVGGSEFVAVPIGDSRVAVCSAGEGYGIYSLEGHVQSRSTNSPGPQECPRTATAMDVTMSSPLLWPLASPSAAAALLGFGILSLGLLDPGFRQAIWARSRTPQVQKPAAAKGRNLSRVSRVEAELERGGCERTR